MNTSSKRSSQILTTLLTGLVAACSMPSNAPIQSRMKELPVEVERQKPTYACGAGGEACLIEGITVTALASAPEASVNA